MTSNEKLFKILNSIQEARKTSINPSLVNLYVTKADGLDDFDANEIWDILHKIEQQDKTIHVESMPLSVCLHAGIDLDDNDIFSSQSHFSIKLLNSFDEWYRVISSKEKSIESVSFDSKTGNLSINNKIVTIRRNTFRSSLIGLLVQNKKRAWNWDEIVERIQDIKDIDVLKKNKKKVYIACDGLQKFIAQKIEINDFLIFNTNTVRINPKYLNTP